MDKISSIRTQLNAEYVKPSIEKLETYEGELWGITDCVALSYLREQRNLTDDTIKHFRLGYDAGRKAVAIPVFKRGELVNIKYRHLEPKEGQAKYSQERDAEVWIYNEEGLTFAQKKGTVLITEGEFDLMSCWQAGSKNVISPASGKDSYGPWIELLDKIPKVYIAYDNDAPGKETSKKMAERVGMEKCYEIMYPEEIKDANEYYRKYTIDEYKGLIETARPFYSYQFKGLPDVINDLRTGDGNYIELKALPDVKMKEDWLVVISGVSNVGKTSYVMNMAVELTDKDIPVLVLPFERGSQVAGTRFLQVKYDKTEGEFGMVDDSEWEKIYKDAIRTPLYFAMPSKDETIELIKKAKRIFNTRVVIIDHLDYMIRNSQHKEQEIGQTLQELKRVAEENKIIMIIVTHIRKIQSAGSQKNKKPNMEDLKGSASLYQDPECVAMLTSDATGFVDVNVVKNKGKMTNRTYKFSIETGRIYESEIGHYGTPQGLSDEDEDLWNSVPDK